MSKRKPEKASKHVHSQKIAVRAQRAVQDTVRSTKDSRTVGARSTESLPRRHDDSKQEGPLVENPVTALQHEAPLVENPVTILQDDSELTMADNGGSGKGSEFSSAMANVRAYQAKLLEMAQANMQFALEFAQRLAAIRSPVEFFGVNAEFTSKRIDMFRKHLKEMAELSTER